MQLFSEKRFLCVFCAEKTSRGQRFGHFGICERCDIAEYMTRRGETFESCDRNKLSYIVAPLYYEGIIREAVRRYKFKDWRGAAAVFSSILGEYIKTFDTLKTFDAVIPVPLSRERMRERGFNQSEPLAYAVSEGCGVPTDTGILLKIKNTGHQSLSNPRERFENVRGAYKVNGDVRDKRIIIVDDIYTTGATMRECADTLISAGATEIIGAALAIGVPRTAVLPRMF